MKRDLSSENSNFNSENQLRVPQFVRKRRNYDNEEIVGWLLKYTAH